MADGGLERLAGPQRLDRATCAVRVRLLECPAAPTDAEPTNDQAIGRATRG
jgi:hypothetical protein